MVTSSFKLFQPKSLETFLIPFFYNPHPVHQQTFSSACHIWSKSDQLFLLYKPSPNHDHHSCLDWCSILTSTLAAGSFRESFLLSDLFQIHLDLSKIQVFLRSQTTESSATYPSFLALLPLAYSIQATMASLLCLKLSIHTVVLGPLHWLTHHSRMKAPLRDLAGSLFPILQVSPHRSPYQRGLSWSPSMRLHGHTPPPTLHLSVL